VIKMKKIDFDAAIRSLREKPQDWNLHGRSCYKHIPTGAEFWINDFHLTVCVHGSPENYYANMLSSIRFRCAAHAWFQKNMQSTIDKINASF
jgi:hypothetical protein